MGGSYRQCVECGKRALSIATRCPGCGRELPDPAGPGSGSSLDLRRFLSPGVLGAVLVGVAVVSAVRLGRSTQPPEPQPSFVAADSIAGYSEGAYAAVPAENPGELLVARTWTNVRTSRSRSAGLEAVLTPGDTVLADSLDRGWYRVALEGEVLGYAHRTALTVPGERTEQ
jgi:hypothetical protein